MSQTSSMFVKQVVFFLVASSWSFFLTVNHRGPLPLREFHSTDETTVWRDPGGSWACLRPVTSEFTQFVFFFFTLNHHGLLLFREVHSTDEMIVWRDPRGSWACLRLQVKSSCQSLWHTRPTCELITHQSPEHNLLRSGQLEHPPTLKVNSSWGYVWPPHQYYRPKVFKTGLIFPWH